MYEIVILNEKGEKFSKIFNSEFLYNNFLSKIKYSKKLTIISYGRI